MRDDRPKTNARAILIVLMTSLNWRLFSILAMVADAHNMHTVQQSTLYVDMHIVHHSPASTTMAVPYDASGFQLLHQLPQEVLGHLLSNFCDGKSLWMLQYALSASSHPFCEETARLVIPLVVDMKLLEIAATLQEHGLPNDVVNTEGAVDWIKAIANSKDIDNTMRSRHLFENTVVLDFLQESLNVFSDADKGHLEWPIWCGEIVVHSSVSEMRMRNTANVVLTTPIQRPAFISGVNLPPKQGKTPSFRLEPVPMIPTPPWGKMRGLTEKDKNALVPIMERLEVLNEVAVPRDFGASEVLDVRILSQTQAHDMLSAVPWSPRESSWIVESEKQKSLICSWHNDEWNDAPVELGRERDYIPHIINLLSVRDQLMCPQEAALEEKKTNHGS